MVVPNGDAGTKHVHLFHEDSPNIDERMGHTYEEERSSGKSQVGKQLEKRTVLSAISSEEVGQTQRGSLQRERKKLIFQK
jgi:hypothetical protein